MGNIMLHLPDIEVTNPCSPLRLRVLATTSIKNLHAPVPVRNAPNIDISVELPARIATTNTISLNHFVTTFKPLDVAISFQ